MDVLCSNQSDTIEELVATSKRQVVPIRWTFLQLRRESGAPGPLHGLVHTADVQALDLYILLHLKATRAPHYVVLDSAVWARALGLYKKSGLELVSRKWNKLEKLKLIQKGRTGRKAKITLLREDGSGVPYTRPQKNFLNIPIDYWTHGWYNRLDLAAKAMLLIALSRGDGFYLPYEFVPAWYGFSADVAQGGLRRLQKEGLLQCEERRKKAPLIAQGWTQDNRYTLQPPFGPKSRKDQVVADKEVIMDGL